MSRYDKKWLPKTHALSTKERRPDGVAVMLTDEDYNQLMDDLNSANIEIESQKEINEKLESMVHDICESATVILERLKAFNRQHR